MGRSAAPLSRTYGYDRGTPIDRLYIDHFVGNHRNDIRGHVLDVGDDSHARRFGSPAVQRIDVLHPQIGHSGASLTADLETGNGFPTSTFDCFLLLETLQVVFKIERAVEVVHDVLKPGGVVLATASTVGALEFEWPDYWRLTSASMRRLFEDRFGVGNVEVTSYGNVLTACAFLYGASAEELDRGLFGLHDPQFEVTVCARAVKR